MAPKKKSSARKTKKVKPLEDLPAQRRASAEVTGGGTYFAAEAPATITLASDGSAVYSTLSNLMKKASDTAAGITDNIK